MTNKFDHKLWGKIVPDGPQFCCWGGKRLIRELLSKLDLQPTDKVLDLCCGQGVMADYMKKASIVVGIDISREAINQAQRLSKNKKAVFVVGNARSLPFADNSFDKIISRDADVWMHKDKNRLMREINRVLTPGGIFVWQSYATSEKPMSSKTRKVLRDVGYTIQEMPYLPKIKEMFEDIGLKVLSLNSLHKIYSEDNLKMLARAKEIKAPSNLIKLLEWEKELFSKNLWTGVLVTARKI